MDLSNYKLENLLLYAMKSEIESKELYTRIAKKTAIIFLPKFRRMKSGTKEFSFDNNFILIQKRNH